MVKRIIITVAVLALISAGFVFQDNIFAFANTLAARVNQELPGFEEMIFDFAERSEFDLVMTEQRVNAPGPLRTLLNNPGALLTVAGTIEATNSQRIDQGLPALTENEDLQKAAQEKLQDMFAQQYFEHVSPDGTSPGKLVESAGYQYVTVGENLALGNYKNDSDLVQAWMDSPPHRENILAHGYTDIGVAVGKGMFEGTMTWLAVQEFGRPLSTCPQVDNQLAIKIDLEQQLLDDLNARIKPLYTELQTGKPDETAQKPAIDEYNKKVDEYNVLVREYNAKGDLLKSLVNNYNRQVKAFNDCLEE